MQAANDHHHAVMGPARDAKTVADRLIYHCFAKLPYMQAASHIVQAHSTVSVRIGTDWPWTFLACVPRFYNLDCPCSG